MAAFKILLLLFATILAVTLAFPATEYNEELLKSLEKESPVITADQLEKLKDRHVEIVEFEDTEQELVEASPLSSPSSLIREKRQGRRRICIARRVRLPNGRIVVVIRCR